MASFSVDVAAWVEHTKEREDIVVREVATELFRRVIMRTPVDKGTARGNWQATIGEPSTAVLDTTDPSGSETIEKMANEVAKAKAGDTVFLANNLPYILPLEYGHSKQAPNGMVGITVNDFNLAVEKAVSEAKKQVPDAG